MEKITVDKAIELINLGKSIDSYEIMFGEKIDAIDAFRLRKNGITVPESLITYEDEDLEYDEEIDGVAWQKLEGRVDETDWRLNVNLVVEKEVKNWLLTNNIRIEELLSSLLHNYYKTEQIVHKK